MGFRWPLLVALLLLNAFAYWALRRSVSVWVQQEDHRKRALRWVTAAVLLLNLPLSAFFFRRLDEALLQVPTSVLAVVFYPSTAWLATLMFFFLFVCPPVLLWAAGSRLRALRLRRDAPPQAPSGGRTFGATISRRRFIAGSAGLLLPGMYAVAAYGTYGNLDELDISPERDIPIGGLPRAWEGMRIVQLTDLHVGAYIREKELRYLVARVNELRPDVVAITGDILDRSLRSLPDAVRGLRGIRSALGSFAVLGNHDIYADQFSYDRRYRGGVRIAEGMETIGIRTLRNEVAYLGEGADRLALLGLDWLSPNPSSPNFYQYKETETIRELRQMSAQVEPGTPKLLLAHHPDTFQEVAPFGIGLTLSGHTHGGGQIILGHLGGVPLGIGMMRFKYLSGLYQENGGSLYVNRGIGYLGIPIRINCPPEISTFRLVRSEPFE
jgi:predicted MPP superfamily phosphohydrolase